MRSVDFWVEGEPAPQGSKSYVGDGRFIESSKKVAPWRAAVAKAVALLGEVEQFSGPVVVEVVFYLPRPKSVRRLWPTVPPDTDKLCRSLGDGLSINASLLSDDSIIVRWEAEKRYADGRPSGAEITIREVDDIPMSFTGEK